MLLAEQGARAIRVEPPGGARERGTAHFHALNRSKRALFFDVQAERARVERLLRWAERRGIRMDRGEDARAPARLRRIFAVSIRILVVLHVPPLGNRGPLANFDASDELVSALGGIYGSQWALSGNPVALAFPRRQLFGGRARRDRDGRGALRPRRDGSGQSRGQLVEVSLLAGAFSLQTGGIMRHEKMTRMYDGPHDPLGPIPCYRLFAPPTANICSLPAAT